MLRTHTCGELRTENIGTQVTLCGWVARNRDLGGMTFIDLRDRYGITQLVFNLETDKKLCESARTLGREFVISVSGMVALRSSKNSKIPTGDIEVNVDSFTVFNQSKIPPFTIEDETDGGEELRMKYRYLDLRRNVVSRNLFLRHRVTQATRTFLSGEDFIETETPVLIKSTPEGARDFVVPSRLNPGEFYALPQSPQTFKQLLMVSGFDRYFQIVKCFRDEDLRADRQPEFTQIDCEMSFVGREDILSIFEAMVKFIFKEVKGIVLPDFPVMSYDEAMSKYGSDKPDLRFDMAFTDLTAVLKGAGFKVFDEAPYIAGIVAQGCATYSRKQLDALTDFVRRPQIGALGMVYIRFNEDGSIKSSVDKFYSEEKLTAVIEFCKMKPGDLLLVLSGETGHTQNALSELRLEMGRQLGLLKDQQFKALWITDFPLLEFDDASGRWFAMHHPFTSPLPGEESLLERDPGKVKANAYDLVINGSEIGGGSIRIHKRPMQEKMLRLLGFSDEEARAQFGFLMDAFEYGAPPHGGIAFGLDRLCAVMEGKESIRDFIAFPKNNAGRDVMIDTPSALDHQQLQDLHISLDKIEN